jgi:hypothetical protein
VTRPTVHVFGTAETDTTDAITADGGVWHRCIEPEPDVPDGHTLTVFHHGATPIGGAAWSGQSDWTCTDCGKSTTEARS